MEFNREEIIKALECHANGCKCGKCPMPKRTKEHHSCWTELSQGALALIKELKAELLKIVEEDIPALAVKEMINTSNAAIMKDAYNIAIQNMKSKLTDTLEFALRASDNGGIYYVDHAVWIDEVAKELLEGIAWKD